MVELSSLIDPSLPAPFVPASAFTIGSTTSGVQSAQYWSATTNAEGATGAWIVYFLNGNLDANSKTQSYFAWCVRGPMNADVY